MSDPVYTVQYDPKALKELAKLDKPVARRVFTRSTRSARTLGRPTVRPDLRRIRVVDYRVDYTIRDTELLVLALRVAHRSAVYRNVADR